jgi:hypothetical protein
VRLTVTDNSGSTAQEQHVIMVRTSRCVVPRLIGSKLARARRLLSRGNCRLGSSQIRRTGRRQNWRVVVQGAKPGATRAASDAVAVTVGN